MSSSFQSSDVRSFPLRLSCTNLLYHYCKTCHSSSYILLMEQNRPSKDNGSPVGMFATNKNNCSTPTHHSLSLCFATCAIVSCCFSELKLCLLTRPDWDTSEMRQGHKSEKEKDGKQAACNAKGCASTLHRLSENGGHQKTISGKQKKVGRGGKHHHLQKKNDVYNMKHSSTKTMTKESMLVPTQSSLPIYIMFML